VIRAGIGYDIHPFDRREPPRPLVLGGVSIPGTSGLAGHSDADVVVHAVCDALLGALALGDLGKHFPDTDPRYAGCSSLDLLRTVATMISERDWHLANLDLSVVAEAPKLAPYVDEMRSNVARILGAPPEAVSIKATRPEGLGALGRGEGIACHAIVLLSSGGGGGAVQ
jgi:2-C-methyl-D-erythritol 2,4-cyclodiphosphate synthase